FDPQTSAFGHEWHLDEWAEGLIQCGKMAPAILVAPFNTPDRMAEYTPVSDPEHPGGNADGYETFLIKELKPWVDGHYRTCPQASDTAIMGSSLGGLLALDAGSKHPDVFGKVAALSPSLWWDNQEMTHRLATAPPGDGPHQPIWVDMGTQEGSDPAAMVQDAEALRDVLEHRGYVDGQNLEYHEIPGATHDEDSWAHRAGYVLAWMFPPGS
ncbi:MAG TPA: alpha/beta hydrolase-fold protein, partial [Candidatus Xenobia bacterium]